MPVSIFGTVLGRRVLFEYESYMSEQGLEQARQLIQRSKTAEGAQGYQRLMFYVTARYVLDHLSEDLTGLKDRFTQNMQSCRRTFAWRTFVDNLSMQLEGGAIGPNMTDSQKHEYLESMILDS